MRRNQCFSECVPGQLYARLDFPRKQRDVPWFSMDGKNFLMLFFPQDVTVVYHILGKVTAAKCFCFQTSFRRKYQLSIGFTQNLKMSVVGVSIIHNIYSSEMVSSMHLPSFKTTTRFRHSWKNAYRKIRCTLLAM